MPVDISTLMDIRRRMGFPVGPDDHPDNQTVGVRLLFGGPEEEEAAEADGPEAASPDPDDRQAGGDLQEAPIAEPDEAQRFDDPEGHDEVIAPSPALTLSSNDRAPSLWTSDAGQFQKAVDLRDPRQASAGGTRPEPFEHGADWVRDGLREGVDAAMQPRRQTQAAAGADMVAPADADGLRQDLVDRRDGSDSDSLRQKAAYRQLTDQQSDIAHSLTGVIANTGKITPNTYYTMRQTGLRIGDVLGPGIYQVEFTPEKASDVSTDRQAWVATMGFNHAQYVYVDGNGASHVLSAGEDAQGRIYVVRDSFDGSGPHSLPTIIGARSETMPIYNVLKPTGIADEQLWKLMNQYADYVGSRKLRYSLLNQNSNSFFYTIAKHFNLGVNHDRWTPGARQDLSRLPRRWPTET